MILSMVLIFFLISCTSITNDKAIIIPNDSSYNTFYINKISKIDTLDKGNLLVIIQNSRAGILYTPDIKEELEKLKEKEFVNYLEYKHIDLVDLETLDFELKTAFNFKYALLISYYSNNAASQSMLHTFLKSSTLNFYDLVPIFSPLIGPFKQIHSFTFEASLIDIKTLYIIKNYKATSHLQKRVKGSNKVNSVENMYDIKLIKETAKKLVANL